LVWPGGEPTPMTWASLGSVGGTWSAGGASGAITGSYQAAWTVEEVGLSWKLDGEDVPGCYRWRRAAQDIILSSTTENDEIGLTCGDMVGLAWNDVVTTTTVSGSPPLVAESSTTLLSVHLP
ncbi:hypothetical protein L6R53_30445, partial [Myxococcota bacterium]|nr:hypothetical protein [Myxococcota bacterium]